MARRFPALGFRLKPVIDPSEAAPTVYSELELEPREAAVMRMAFQRASETGEGSTRLSRWWNENPEIPEDFKPISATTLAYRLQNSVNIGTLVWAANQTGVVNDCRVVEPNAETDVLRITGFCTPLVSEELFNNVRSLMQARSRQIKRSREKATPDRDPKLIAPQARGLTLKYLLTGLIRCGSCNASMRPGGCGSTSKVGRKYAYYSCPRHLDGACENSRHFPERALRDVVTARLRDRLFPPPEHLGEVPAWLPKLMNQVQHEFRPLPGRSTGSNGGDRARACGTGSEISWLVHDPGQPAAVTRCTCWHPGLL